MKKESDREREREAGCVVRESGTTKTEKYTFVFFVFARLPGLCVPGWFQTTSTRAWKS